MDNRPLRLRGIRFCVNHASPVRRFSFGALAEQKEFDPGKAPKKRLPERDPERSKLLLIEATLDALAENGISEATVSKIIARAGVSRGMIHLHFGSKDALIGAAAKLFSERYYDEMERQLTDAANGPTATVLAVVRADLGPQLMNKKSVAIWHALRGEAHRNATIGKVQQHARPETAKADFRQFCRSRHQSQRRGPLRPHQ